MKDWALEHPVMAFLLADALICMIGNVVSMLCYASKGGEV